MIMLNVGIGSVTEITGQLNSGDLKNMTSKLDNCQPLDLYSADYSLESTYKDEVIVHQ